MIVIASFLLGILACGLRSTRACLLAGMAVLALAGLGGDWIQATAAIGAYNMGVALALCGAIAIGLQRDRR
ncbi:MULTISPECIES: hypothetical protein [unclassified Ensifer]|uniref:hypothetical protein n=1 Tax=unclassified Ensifer TaxID=2633371 RepID=UPI000813AD8C|nr:MULTISPECIES: hypothetical protein [unclassified Ensifer]OCP07488.1 hypothetical protein BBX50_21385 [Ensifer sp. LC11]OCP07595.1 hypothetical protein BC362_10645 [Ensifer sp. LC14]OCP08263.1 hypothetical protein BC374_21600 [Ensifer sp. LC13]OCP31984.1 hypothetical protein BC364_20855 [Ensifer sp. LC499]